ncbi:hypothetical protein [Micromonospora maritima]|uniref:hypothetical protein n=1 Tax=Micromonospora maritima TaxID=986711 RepID=UPI00157CD2DB|nr:hypothetical protein [Micromonospora maritima]
MAYEIGTAYIQIVPSFDHIQRELRKGAEKIAKDLGEGVEKALPDTMAQSVKAGIKRAEKVAEQDGRKIGEALAASTGDASKQVEKATEQTAKVAARKYVDFFEEEFRRRAAAAHLRLPKPVLDGPAIGGEDAQRMVELSNWAKRLSSRKFTAGVEGEVINEARALRNALAAQEQVSPSRQYRSDLAAARAEIDRFLSIIEDRMGAFQRKVTSDVGRAAKQLSTLDVNHLNDRARDEVNDLRKELLDLSGKRIGIDIDDSKFMERLTKVRQRLEQVVRAGETAELRWNADQALQAVDDAFQATMTSVEKAQREAQARAEKEAEAEAKRQAIRQERLDDQAEARRQRLADLEQQRLKRKADAEEQLAKRVEALEEQRLKRKADQEEMLRQRQEQFEVRQAQQRKERSDREAAQEAKRLAEAMRREADEAFGRTFAGKVAKQIEAAFKALPETPLPIDASQGEIAVRQIRADLERLKDLRIGVDIDAAEALRYITQIRAALVELGQSDPDLAIHVDSLEAAARLAEAERMADRLDGRRIDLKLSGKDDIREIGEQASVSLSRLEALIAGGLSLGTGLVPVAAAAAASIGFIGTAAAAAAAGVGALVLGFSGIGDAVQALHKYQQDSQKSSVAFAAAQDRVASATDAVTSAQRSLANTRASAAEAARRAAQQVADAERAVRDARADAAQAVRDANERERDAQRDLTRVNRDALEARQALTRAYRDAAEAMADLDSQIKNNALDQRQATLDLREAKEELDRFLANPRATEAEREAARITYERRVQQIKDLQRRGQELAREQAEANRKGIEGSDQVLAARRRISEADERVAAAQRALQKARDAVERAQLDGARKVADAQRRVAEAQRSQTEQQRQSAFSIAQAQQQVISSQRALGQAIDKTTVAGGEAFQNLRKVMEDLDPASQRFARFIYGLKPQFDALQAAAARGLLPGVQRAIETVLPYLPAFTDWMGRVADAVGDLTAESVQFLTTDSTWRGFFAFLGEQAVPMLQQLYRITRDVATGALGMIMAFTGLNGEIGSGLESLAARFRDWGANLWASTGFQDFLAYARENGPAVIHLLGELITFVARFIEAAAPIGAVVLAAFTGFVEVLNAIPMPILTLLLVVIGGLAAAMLAFSSAQRLSTLWQNSWSKATAFASERATGLRNALGGLQNVWASSVAAQRESLMAMRESRSAMAATGDQVGTFARQWGALAGAQQALGSLQERTRDAMKQVGDSYFFARGRLSELRESYLTTTGAATQWAGVQERTRAVARQAGESYLYARGRLSDLRMEYLTAGGAGRAWTQISASGSEVMRQAGDAYFYTRSRLSDLRTEYGAAGAMGRAWNSVQEAGRASTERVTSAFGTLGGHLTTFRDRLGSAQLGTRTLATALGTVQAGAKVTGRALGGLVGVLGGPWGAAITAATLAAVYFTGKSQEQEQKVNDLTQALHLLGKAYRETRDLSSDSVRDVIAQSEELKKLVDISGRYGIAVQDIADAAEGEAAAQMRVLDVLKAKRKALEEEKRQLMADDDADQTIKRIIQIGQETDALDGQIGALEKQFTQLNLNARAQAALTAAQDEALAKGPALTDSQRKVNDKLAEYGERINYLKGLLRLYGDAQLTAAQKADILRDAIDQATKSKISAIEAEERHQAALDGIKSSVDSNRESLKLQAEQGLIAKDEIDKRSKSLSSNTEEGRRNRDALEAAAESVRNRYIADIESGVPMDEATRRHKARIDALIKEAGESGLNEKKARELIAAYGEIPPEVKTAYTTKGYQQIYEELVNLQIAQFALEQGLTPDEAAKEWRKQRAKTKPGDYTGAGGLKDGGPVTGTPLGAGGPRSDDVPIWASLGEYMQPADAVNYYGVGFMEAVRRRLIPKEMLPGYATGGLIGSKVPKLAKGGPVPQWPFVVDVSDAYVPTKDEALAVVLKRMGAGAGTASSGGIGSADMMRILRAKFPGLPLYSGFRPGSRTASGSLSYHAMIAADGDKGRAVDLPPRQDVFDYIHDNFFSATRELIWLGDKFRNIWNGQHHKFSDSLLANHGVAGMPNAHLHWAYDQGGYLPPGFTTVYNGTGKPEPVFTDGQWSQISALLAERQSGDAGGETHHWHFAKADLDHGRLTAWANARDAAARPGRPR